MGTITNFGEVDDCDQPSGDKVFPGERGGQAGKLGPPLPVAVILGGLKVKIPTWKSLSSDMRVSLRIIL